MGKIELDEEDLDYLDSKEKYDFLDIKRSNLEKSIIPLKERYDILNRINAVKRQTVNVKSPLIIELVDLNYLSLTNWDKWEFWIVVKNVSQGGTVQTELCSRWQVNMRPES